MSQCTFLSLFQNPSFKISAVQQILCGITTQPKCKFTAAVICSLGILIPKISHFIFCRVLCTLTHTSHTYAPNKLMETLSLCQMILNSFIIIGILDLLNTKILAKHRDKVRCRRVKNGRI